LREVKKAGRTYTFNSAITAIRTRTDGIPIVNKYLNISRTVLFMAFSFPFFNLILSPFVDFVNRKTHPSHLAWVG
jgi:hypothetical protein